MTHTSNRAINLEKLPYPQRVNRSDRFCAGDWVEVLSKEEILRTLDRKGQFQGLPFMPEMFAFCGKRFRVVKRAHKTCDTVNQTGARRMASAIHLEGVRCTGESHGDCQAMCLVFWKEVWVKRVGASQDANEPAARTSEPTRETECTETDVLAAVWADPPQAGDEPQYVCQATRLPDATSPLPWWRVSQYVEDYFSGNVTLVQLIQGGTYSAAYNLIQAGIGLGRPLRWLYDRIQAVTGGIPFPRRSGAIPVGQPTPTGSLELQPGELVRVKSYQEILTTLNSGNYNRGLFFDAEMVPYCGGTYRVLRVVHQILDEKTGKVQRMKSPCIILDGVACQARFSTCRMFCPRGIYPYWREIWLERVESTVPGAGDRKGQASPHT